MTPALIVLGGGGGNRLGGISKPDLEIRGRRMLDIVLEAGCTCSPRVAVVPATVRVPQGVERTLEDPPDGGPVAGIAAGLVALRRSQLGDGDVLVLACDLPGAGDLVDPLLRARRAHTTVPGTSVVPWDGVIALEPDGSRAMVALLASRRALEGELERGGSRDRSVRSLLAALRLAEVVVPEGATEDVDTWDQHARWETRR